MFFHTWRRIRRAPLPAVAVILFAAILSMALCGLEAANQREQESYQHIFQTTPVTLTVTNLTGTQSKHLDAPGWVSDVFIGDTLLPHTLKGYVKEINIHTDYRMNPTTETIHIDGTPVDTGNVMISGITSEKPVEESGIQWLHGYDEAVLLTAERICLIPEAWITNGQLPDMISMVFTYTDIGEGLQTVTHQYDLSLVPAGTHQADEATVFCPFAVVKGIYAGLNKKLETDSIQAVLADNSLLTEAEREARYWFPEPDLSGEKIPWNYSWYSYYPYALRIDDSQLRSAENAMKNSLRINSICTILVFALSAAAGFFIGFLMIRSRKREIALMRIMGTPLRKICGSYVLEQMLCIVLGVILGGVYFLWQPVGHLTAFAGIYCLGLGIALLIFLHTNLLTTMKEDE